MRDPLAVVLLAVVRFLGDLVVVVLVVVVVVVVVVVLLLLQVLAAVTSAGSVSHGVSSGIPCAPASGTTTAAVAAATE